MALSRKQRKQLTKLRSSASDLWDEQRNVLAHAGGVFRESGRQLGNVSKEEVVPLVRGVVNGQLVPAVASGYHATKSVAGDVRHKVSHDLLPGVSSSFVSALAALEASDPRVRDAVKKVKKTGGTVGAKANSTFSAASKEASRAYNRVGTRVGFVQPKKTGLGFGGWALISLGVVIVAGIAYAAWQTLRADDELWVLDETDDTDKPL